MGSRPALAIDAEVDLFISEVTKLSGFARRINLGTLDTVLEELVRKENINRATIWKIPLLSEVGVSEKLSRLGVEIILPTSGKEQMATCDLGVTGADFALAETGTIGLLSALEKPRSVSLLPRVHLAIFQPSAFRADLGQVFDEAKGHGYLVFITGPSRTADIELTVTLGVHGPKSLNAWILDH